jgi:hypothetical protein
MLMKTRRPIYQEIPTPQYGLPHHVSGQYLAKNRLSARERARLAAGIIGGEVTIQNLTVAQTARLCRVCVPYVEDVRRQPSACDVLVRGWDAATDAERVEFGRRIGADRLFDKAIMPVIS